MVAFRHGGLKVTNFLPGTTAGRLGGLCDPASEVPYHHVCLSLLVEAVKKKKKKSPPRFKGWAWACVDHVSRREFPGICSPVSEQPHLAAIVRLLRVTKTPGDIGYSIASTCVGEL